MADVADCPLQRLSAIVIKNIIIIIIIIIIMPQVLRRTQRHFSTKITDRRQWHCVEL